jgi:hypothetical protein
MPYWLCDMCTGAGLIGGQVQVKSDTGSAICRVHFRNIHRALEFALAAGGEDAPGTAELRRRAESSSENPWQHLPETVQHRIQVWWSPRQGERFLTYVPDRDHVRTEDGMAGIVVTSQRLIHHTPLRHKEIPINERVELKLATSSGRGKLKIQTRNWDVKRMTIDREGISRLRRGLTLAKFPAVWA